MFLLPSAILVMWLAWSISATPWRIWAFSNVRNVHELKRKAIQERLVSTKRFVEKTEIRTKSQKRKLLELEQKFSFPDIFEDDPTIPYEVVLRFSKRDKIGGLALGLVLISAGLYWVFVDGNYYAAIIFLVGDYIAITSYRRMRNLEPQLTLNEKGMQTADGPFLEWRFLSQIDVSQNALRYEIGELSNHVLELSELDMKPANVERHIRIYLGREEQRRKVD